jgi:hypothetical protein
LSLKTGIKRDVKLLTFAVLLCSGSPCFADWNCDDWVARRGYCVDYVKSKIPSFPVPDSDDDIKQLNNKQVRDVVRGDVAIFDLGRYWHVAYVENVRRDHRGNAISIDISEKNYGPRMTPDHYLKTWGSRHGSEWKRAVWCGVTKKYGQNGMRTNVPIDTVEQIWTPRPSLSQRIRSGSVTGLLDRAREFMDGLVRFHETGS